MCGIAGIVKLEEHTLSLSEVEKMINCLHHRGPDEKGIFTDYENKVSLGHSRLSIIDLKTGTQPLYNEDNNVILVCNGEIYNFLELRQNLEKNGHRFKTYSDNEVVLHLWEEKKEELLSQLNGMFAFGLFDKKKRCLFIGRDRLGQKPLYYYLDDKSFIFASELEAILEITKPSINYEGLYYYLLLQYIPAPHTILKKIKKLMPASWLLLDIFNKKVKIGKYWQFPTYVRGVSFKKAQQELKFLIEDAVKIRLVADVPVGTFLSGGLDSSIITYEVSSVNKNIKAFSIGFKEEHYNELEYAQCLVKEFQIPHLFKYVKSDAIKLLRDIIKCCGEPFGDSSLLPTYLLSKFARQYVKVALSGDGADELFGGYYRYLAMYLSKKLKIFPHFSWKLLNCVFKYTLPNKKEERTWYGRLKTFFQVLQQPFFASYIKLIAHFTDTQIRSLLLPEFYYDIYKKFQRSFGANKIEDIILFDLNMYLPYDILFKVDTASMANSLEVRNPFLDYRIVEFALSLPLEYKLKIGCRKYILTKTYSSILPKKIIKRSKMGFGVPLARWFRKELKKELYYLLSKESYILKFMRPDFIKLLIEEHIKEKNDHSRKLWNLLFLEKWLSYYKPQLD